MLWKMISIEVRKQLMGENVRENLPGNALTSDSVSHSSFVTGTPMIRNALCMLPNALLLIKPSSVDVHISFRH